MLYLARWLLYQADACMHVGAALGLAILFAWSHVEKVLDRLEDRIDNSTTGSNAGNDLVDDYEAAPAAGSHLVSHGCVFPRRLLRLGDLILALPTLCNRRRARKSSTR